ncbi:hypothetical protein [Brucella pseudintermedia]|uniref:hypothetical protein n=1 Tax=Brucella pseudintermedia TaxID=370111 RepID=UPI0030F4691E
MAKFKVGDRVRNHKVPEAGIGTIEEVRESGGYLVHFKDTWFGLCSDTGSSLEPAPLTIETGKFYRTRDGHKVGPMRRYNDGWLNESDDHGRMWRDDGMRYYEESRGGGSDLVAEWLDAPASNDNANPAIVALIEDGHPKPLSAPKVHKSEQSATDEAERLAIKYPGQKFGVFVLADARIADVVIRRAA